MNATTYIWHLIYHIYNLGGFLLTADYQKGSSLGVVACC